MNESGQIFWLDKWQGKAKSGAYTRCNLNDCIKIMNDAGAKVVGIKIDFDGGWNLEFIIEGDSDG